MAKVGRPPLPVPTEKAEAILAQMAEGTPLATICKQPGYPGITTVFHWTVKDPQFAESFARARVAQAAREVDEALAIADAATPDTVAVAKLRVDTRLKRAACFCPSLFGTRQQAEGVGAITITVVTGVPQPEPSPRRLTVTAAPPPALADDDEA